MEKSKTLDDVFIFTIDWRNRENTNFLINSLRQVNTTLWIIVNDNLPEKYKVPQGGRLKIQIYRTGKNVGFAAACNVALELAQRNGASFLMHFNNDTVIEDVDQLIPFVELLRKHPEYAVVSPTIMKTSGEVQFAGSSWLFGISPSLPITHRKIPDPKKNEMIPSHYFSGSCFLARTDLLFEIDGFDEEYFAYREEIDLAARLTRKGWLLGYTPYMTVLHNASASSARFPYFKEFLLTRGQLLYLKKNVKGLQKILYVLIFSMKIMFKLLCAFKDRNKEVFFAVRDALLNQLFKRGITVDLDHEKIKL